MKITWITGRFPPDAGGMSRSSHRIVSSLRDRGHSVHVVHLCRSRSHNTDSAGHSNPAEADFPHDLPGEVLVSTFRSDAYEQLFFSLQKKMAGSVLVGFGGGMPAYLAVLWAGWLGSRSVALFRGNDYDRITHDPRNAWVIQFILQHADLIGTVSTEMQRRVRAFRQGPVVFTPNGVSPEEWTVFERDMERASTFRESQNITTQKVAGIFGQLKYKKGLHTAAAIFSLPWFREHAHLLTVGDVPQYMQNILSTSCSRNWTALPYQETEDLPPYYLASDVVFIPSYYDGMPNVLLEAMSVGIPVAGSDAGGMPDVISHGEDGFIFKAGDLQAAAETLKKALCLDAEEKKQIIKAAQDKIRARFSPEHEAGIIENAIAQVSLREGRWISPGK